MNTGLKVAGVAIAGVVALTACDPGSGNGSTTYTTNGPAGQIVDRDYEHGHYELETKSGGKKKEFNVTASVYNDCHLYQFYPSCVSKSTIQKDNKHKKTYKNPKAKKNTKKKGFSWGFGSKKSGSSKKKR